MINNSQNVIGLLDSGVGGLSILKEIYNVLPNENYIYFGDTKNVPYGTKTKEEILTYAVTIINFLIEQNVNNIVIACNTTSAITYDVLTQLYSNNIKIYPLIQSVAPYASLGMKDGDTIAILATRATINSKKYEEEIKKYNRNINVIGIDCTGFVEIVENRLYDDKNSIDLIKSKLEIAQKHNAKRIVLGCTHYPYLVDIFKNILNVEYFNPAASLAKIVKEGIKSQNQKGSLKFYVSKNPQDFILSANTFFDVKDVQLIDLK